MVGNFSREEMEGHPCPWKTNNLEILKWFTNFRGILVYLRIHSKVKQIKVNNQCHASHQFSL